MISRDLFRQIRLLQLKARRAVEDVLGGEYHSVFKGTGMVFEEVREYQPGDDVRTIDWNVTARMGHPFIKRYVEERELTLMLLVDCSASQQFELAVPGLDQGGYALWDASLVWRSDDDRWSIGLHGRNLTDKRYIVSGYNFLRQNPDTGLFVLANGQPGLSSTLGAEGVLTAYYGNPRQVYLSVGLNF